MRSIFSGTHPAQTIDRRNVDNVDKENESVWKPDYGNERFGAKDGKGGKSAGNVYKDYVNKKIHIQKLKFSPIECG